MAQERITLPEILNLSKQLIEISSTCFEPQVQVQALDLAHQHLSIFTYEPFEMEGIRSSLYYNSPQRPRKFRVILNSHLDVVTGSPRQFKPIEKDGYLYGRGAMDMKGAAAAQILVFRELAKDLSYPIALQLTTDEETGGFKGTGYQIEQGVDTDFMITGEATDLNIGNESKGVLVFQLDMNTNKPAHAAYLWDGDNVLEHMNKFLKDLWEVYPIPRHEEWSTTVNVASIQTPNIEHNKVPDQVSILLDFRHIRQHSAEDITQKLTDLIPKDTVLTLKAQGLIPYTDPNHPDLQTLARSINHILTREPKYVAKNGASDARFYSAIGAGAVEFGPIGKGIHTEDECVDTESLGQYARILEHFLESLKTV